LQRGESRIGAAGRQRPKISGVESEA
jgi:hypothetical protein